MTPFIQELPRHYQRSPQDAELQRVLEHMSVQAEIDKDFSLEQLFPSTASGWGLALWEAAYGLQREPEQTEEQRRACILAKIKQVGPSTPELIRSIAQYFSPYLVKLTEFPAEYRFELRYRGTLVPWPVERPGELRTAVNERKPAHLAFDIILELTSRPFVETPGYLIFRRFTMAWAVSNRRSGYHFDGSAHFGNDILFNQADEGVSLRSYGARISAKHAECLNGIITMDNWRTFDSEIRFDGARSFNAYIKEEEL